MLFFSLWFGDPEPLSELIILTFPMDLFGDGSYLMCPWKIKKIESEGQEPYILTNLSSLLSPHPPPSDGLRASTGLFVLEVLRGNCKKCTFPSPPQEEWVNRANMRPGFRHLSKSPFSPPQALGPLGAMVALSVKQCFSKILPGGGLWIRTVAPGSH